MSTVCCIHALKTNKPKTQTLSEIIAILYVGLSLCQNSDINLDTQYVCSGNSVTHRWVLDISNNQAKNKRKICTSMVGKSGQCSKLLDWKLCDFYWKNKEIHKENMPYWREIWLNWRESLTCLQGNKHLFSPVYNFVKYYLGSRINSVLLDIFVFKRAQSCEVTEILVYCKIKI